MTTRRPITCFILSALLFSSCSVASTDPPRRTVRVKALADPSFRARNANWNEELRALIESASDYFEREFAIHFVTESTAAWPADERTASTPALLARLKREFRPDAGERTHD